MKSLLNQNIINKYIFNEFGDILNPPTKDEIIKSINDYDLTLNKVKLWSLFGGNLLIKGINGRTIIHSASWMGQLDIVHYVLDKGVDVDSLNDFNETPLIYAVSKCGRLEMVNYLLKQGANINHQDVNERTVLHYACSWNQLEFVKLLVEGGINIYLKANYYKQNQTALDVAKYKNYHEIVDYLTPFYNNN